MVVGLHWVLSRVTWERNTNEPSLRSLVDWVEVSPIPEGVNRGKTPALRSVQANASTRMAELPVKAKKVSSLEAEDDAGRIQETPGEAGGYQGLISLQEIVGRKGNLLPRYPKLAIHRGWQGRVEVELKIDVAGRVETFKVVKSSGFQVLDHAAVRAARHWSIPEYASSSVRVPIEFVIGSGE